jgi:DNA-binding MarR family transcriptional regulator
MAAAPVPTTDDAAHVCDLLADDLGWALGAVFRSYAKAATSVFVDLPGGPRGYQVLAAATSDALGTQLALANQLGIDRTVMTYLLDDLERAGLIERRPDPSDRRVRRIAVTDQGRELIAEYDRRLKETEDRLLAVLGEPDRTTFRTLLRRLAMQVAAGEHRVDACQAVQEAGLDGDQTAAAPRRTRRRAG